jgi:hypothetical protein
MSFAEPLLRISTNILGPRLSLLCGVLARLLRNTSYLGNPALLLSFSREGYYRFWHKYSSELVFLGLFDFIEWNEDDIITLIREELNWKKPDYWPTTWRSDCKIHFLKEYLYRETIGFTKNDELLSGMIRAGMITREEALKRSQNDNDLPVRFLSMFLTDQNIDISEIDDALRRYHSVAQV